MAELSVPWQLACTSTARLSPMRSWSASSCSALASGGV